MSAFRQVYDLMLEAAGKVDADQVERALDIAVANRDTDLIEVRVAWS